MNLDEQRFRRQIDSALTRVRTIMENSRNPTYPADVPHQYIDKFALAEFLVKTGCASHVRALAALGLTAEGLDQLKGFAANRSVTLRLKAEERCTFIKKVVREEESKSKYVTEYQGTAGSATITDKVVTTIEEWLWSYEVAYEIIAFRGSSPDEGCVPLLGRSGAVVLTTSSDTTPRPAVTVCPSVDANITWLLARLTKENTVDFKIDREHPLCRTPRRNPDVTAALTLTAEVSRWMRAVHSYFTSVFSRQPKHGLDMGALNAAAVFVPVVPLFEEVGAAMLTDGTAAEGVQVGIAASAPSPVALSPADSAVFLDEESRSLNEKLQEISAAFPDNEKLVTRAEASIVVVAVHCQNVSKHIGDGVDYIEMLLYKGLIAAIGKIVTPRDFAEYMVFHNRRLFREEYAPRPFSYAIRRPDHYPEGTIAIEANNGDAGGPQPVPTVVRRIEQGIPMTFPLDASTEVTFGGERYLHSMICHRFSDGGPVQMFLSARARQFSSFILLVGKIASGTSFEPSAAIMIQNKDDLKIPLNLEEIPTPKAFRDAIEALSPEQQRFCKAYRQLQLSATLFGICVIQIKPQMEKLLGLPDDSLTKEIKLTQELMTLFVEYQIPSDQLKFDGNPQTRSDMKIAAVKSQVAAMNAIIQQCKDEELAEQRQERDMAKLQAQQDNPFAGFNMSPTGYQPQMALGGMGFGGGMPPGGGGFGGGGPVYGAMPSMAYGAMPSMAMPQGNMGVPFESFAAPTASGDLLDFAPPAPPPTTSEAPAPTQAAPPSTSPAGTAAPQLDVASLPRLLDARFEEYDEDAALRPTIISAGTSWTKTSCKTLLSKPVTEGLSSTGQEKEKNTAFDLLDALSRSGTLPIDCAALHVVVAATHCFDRTLLDTIVQHNVNPIEKVERSVLIAASVVHNTPPAELVSAGQLERASTYSPKLFGPDAPVAICDSV